MPRAALIGGTRGKSELCRGRGHESVHAAGRPPKFGAVFLVRFEEFSLPERRRTELLDDRESVQAGIALRHLGNAFRIVPSSASVTGEGTGPSHGRLCKRIRHSQQFDERLECSKARGCCFQNLSRSQPIVGIVLREPLSSRRRKNLRHPIAHEHKEDVVDLPLDLRDPIENAACPHSCSESVGLFCWPVLFMTVRCESAE